MSRSSHPQLRLAAAVDQSSAYATLSPERLANALYDDRLELYFQPKVNMRTAQVVGVEALLRWQHPEMGLLQPDCFLPAAGDSDLIVEVGEWVIRSALRQIANWQEIGLQLAVSVNLAPRQLQHPNFLPALRNVLDDFPDVHPAMLELEILESAALENTTYVRQVIETCRNWGMVFALDDFGTGYASLAYLRDIPVDVVKIDQRFIRGLLEDDDDRALVEGVITLAKAFRRSVVAEGIECPEQGLLLMRMGCDIGQGYGIAHPMQETVLKEWVEHYQPHPEWQQWADVPWEMDDFPLLMARYDHRLWVQRILDHIDGENTDLSDLALGDLHQCRFGRWYCQQGQTRYGHLREFIALADLHEAAHTLAPEIVRLHRTGNVVQASAKTRTLLALKDDLLGSVAELQKAVADRPLPRGELAQCTGPSRQRSTIAPIRQNRIDILTVDDTPANIEKLANVLANDYTVRVASSGRKTLELAEHIEKPDLILIDVTMPELDGYEVCRHLKLNPATRDISIIFITDRNDLAAQLRGFNLGGVDYISKPFHPPVVAARVRSHLNLKLRTDLLASQASLDELTGIPNRCQLDQMLRVEWRRTARNLIPISFLMLDIDHFKAYSDYYGHGAGDECLRQISRAMLSAQLRPGDFIARYGGGEFAVILPGCNAIGSRTLAERFRAQIETLGIPHARSPNADHITASIGAATMKPSSGGELADLLADTDKALYRAKQDGGNRVVLI